MSKSAAGNERASSERSSPETSEPADRLADALFSAFVFIADTGPGITASDVDAMHAWIRSQSKAQTALRPCIDRLSGQFLHLWKHQVASGKKPDPSLIADSIWHWRASVGEQEAARLEDAVASLLEVFAPVNPGFIARVRGRATPECRLQARRMLEKELEAPPVREDVASAQSVNATAARFSSTDDVARNEEDQLLLPAWPKGRRKLRCVAVIDETHDAKTFVFEGVEPRLFSYRPGQFITLELPMADGKRLRRSYTLSSSPSRPHRISITVKRVPGGRGSNWLHEHVTAGFECNVTGPHGKFTCGIAPSYPKLLFIAAGSGITPIASMLRWLADSVAQTDVVVINNVRTPDDVIFCSELPYLASRLGSRCRLAIVPSRVPSGRQWIGPTGRFSRNLLEAIAPDCLERQVYTCGPAPYMARVRDILDGIGLPNDQYHEERFCAAPTALDARAQSQDTAAGLAERPPATPLSESRQPAPIQNLPKERAREIAPATVVAEDREKAENSATRAIVHFQRSDVRLSLMSGDNLLDAAEANGIDVPSSCRAGDCGTCKVRKISGDIEIDWENQRALSADEIKDGWVLCCMSELKAGTLEIDA